MTHLEKLGWQLQVALSLDIPAELAAQILTTSNSRRLQELFQQASQRLLAAHQEVVQRPNSALASQQRLRSKALLDLVRARIATVGCRKPSVDKMLAVLDRRPQRKVVDIRKAA